MSSTDDYNKMKAEKDAARLEEIKDNPYNFRYIEARYDHKEDWKIVVVLDEYAYADVTEWEQQFSFTDVKVISNRLDGKKMVEDDSYGVFDYMSAAYIKDPVEN